MNKYTYQISGSDLPGPLNGEIEASSIQEAREELEDFYSHELGIVLERIHEELSIVIVKK